MIHDSGWYERRKNGIGGSDIAAVFDLSPWKSAYQLYLEKRGEADRDNSNMEAKSWGQRMEPVIREWYSETTGEEVWQPEEMIVSPEYPWMYASVDGLVGNDKILEIKTDRVGTNWGDVGTDQIPDYYALQCHYYLTVLDKQITDVAVMIKGASPEIYTLNRDAEMSEMIIKASYNFMEAVKNGNPPEAKTYTDRLHKHRDVKDKAVVASGEIFDVYEQLKRLSADIRDLEQEKDFLKTRIMEYLGINHGDVLLDSHGDKIVTWKQTTPRTVLDTNKLKSEMPEIYKKYAATKDNVRMFLVK